MSYKHYPDNIKSAIIAEVKEGLKPQVKIAEETGIPQATLSRWANSVKVKQQKKFKNPIFTPKKKDYSEMEFSELLAYLPSKENKNYAEYLNEQYKDKGIALRYCLVILKPQT